MPAKLAPYLKSIVIQQWLQGKSRDIIAKENGVSAGAVTNIVDEWREGIGQYIANDLRELSIILKKANMTPAQCSAGFRISSIMNKLGVNEKDFESFIVNVYKDCKDKGLPIDKVASYIKDLLSFSDNINSFSEFPQYLIERKEEKESLEDEIEKLKVEINILKNEKNSLEIQKDKALENQRITATKLKWYIDLKQELEKFGIAVEEITEFATLVNNVKEFGFDAGKVIKEFENLHYLLQRQKIYRDLLPGLEVKKQNLKQECSRLENIIASHSQTLSVFGDLVFMGLNLKELKLLRNTVNEIASANGIPQYDAVKKFLADVEEQYDNKLGFESKLELLKEECGKLREEYNRFSASLLANPLTGPALFRLFEQGVKEQEIVLVSRMLKDDRIKNNVQLLLDKIKEYKDFEILIDELKYKAEALENKIKVLQNLQNNLYRNVQEFHPSLLTPNNEKFTNIDGSSLVEEKDDDDVIYKAK